MDKIAIIPVYNPEPKLKELCQSLLDEIGQVLVVDDGSTENARDFDGLPTEVIIVRHPVNRGKGRAIKTGLAWVRENCPGVRVVVFADGDGQHRPEDVKKVAMCTLGTERIALGVRDFSVGGIPLRSRFGNVLTSFLVRKMFGFPIFDTQTGLRAIPVRLFDAMLKTDGERYEYEMRLFGMLRAHGESLEQVPIETIYIENNRASHFRPIRDSLRVYHGLFGGVFLKFCMSSIIGFVSDNLIFTFILFAVQSQGWMRRYDILVALVVARVFSASVNYFCNRQFVFKSSSGVFASFMRYWAVVLLVGALSYGGTTLVAALFDATGLAITLLKILVETIIFMVSYQCQKKWVFAR